MPPSLWGVGFWQPDATFQGVLGFRVVGFAAHHPLFGFWATGGLFEFGTLRPAHSGDAFGFVTREAMAMCLPRVLRCVPGSAVSANTISWTAPIISQFDNISSMEIAAP